MNRPQPGPWNASTHLARAILSDRKERRKWLGRLIMIPLLMVGVGGWVIDEWIWADPWHVFFWWGGCMSLTLMVVLFAAYDALAVVREERAKNRRDADDF